MKSRSSIQGRVACVRRHTGVAVVLAMSLALAACEEPAPPAPDLVRSVKTVVVSERAERRERDLSGVLAASRSSELSFAVSGTIVQVLVEQGAPVTAGQVLALLDDQPLLLVETGARARLTSARANLEEQRRNFERQQTLYQRDIVARAALDRAQAALTSAQADVRAAESEVARAERDRGRTALTAPFDGRVASRQIDPFQEIAAGRAAFVLEGEEGLEARVLVPETMIRDVAHGDGVRLSFPTLQNATLPGTVTEIGSRMDAGNAFPVTVRLEGDGIAAIPDLRPGMTVRASFALRDDAAEAGFLVPLSAIAVGGGGEGQATEQQGDAPGPDGRPAPIFVFDEASATVRRVTVQVGDLRGNLVEVRGGLLVGDKVVVAGVAFLRDGMPARLWTPDL